MLVNALLCELPKITKRENVAQATTGQPFVWALSNRVASDTFLRQKAGHQVLWSVGNGSPVKIFKHRKAMIGAMMLGAMLLSFGVDGLWRGLTHHGPGVWEFGGPEPGTGGNVETPEYRDTVSESSYKRLCYRDAATFFLFGGLFLYGAVDKWRERSDLEKSWRRRMSDPQFLRDVQVHPERYRDDFKQWIKETHPGTL